MLKNTSNFLLLTKGSDAVQIISNVTRVIIPARYIRPSFCQLQIWGFEKYQKSVLIGKKIGKKYWFSKKLHEKNTHRFWREATLVSQ